MHAISNCLARAALFPLQEPDSKLPFDCELIGICGAYGYTVSCYNPLWQTMLMSVDVELGHCELFSSSPKALEHHALLADHALNVE
jgi:hypothetical protein